MPPTFHRTSHTWLLYLSFAIFGYVINALGPVTPFLKSDLGLSYTVTSLIFSAFAAGIILTGLFGHMLVAQIGRTKVRWLGLFGMCLAMLGMAAARSASMTVAAAFLTGCIGGLLPAVATSSLADEHGDQRSVAYSELNLVAAVSSAAAPLLVGWFSYTLLGWRFALAIPLAAAVTLFFSMGRGKRATGPAASRAGEPAGGSLPALYWAFWAAILLANAIEYCMLFWSADYLENAAGLPRSVAAQAVSLFLTGMILGRLAGSRLLLRYSARHVVTTSIMIASAGFSLYWLAAEPWMPVVGLFLTGLGVANMFPIILSMAIGAAPGSTDKASMRSALATGIAIFVLPLVLGRLADAVGIRLAYALVAVLLAAAFTVIQLASRRAARLLPAAS